MKCLITGASGFLGRHLRRALLSQNEDVLVLDEGTDIRDFTSVYEKMEGVHTVFHLAACAELSACKKDVKKAMDTNIMGTLNCLLAAKEAEVNKFVFASSVYAAGDKGSFYGVSKRAAEDLCKAFFREYGLPYVILRYGSLYGSDSNDWNMVYRLCKTLLDGNKFSFWGTGEEIREYIYIQDAVRCTIRAAMCSLYNNSTLLITGLQRMRIRELFDLVQEMVGVEGMIEYTYNDTEHYKLTPYTYSIRDFPQRLVMDNFTDINDGLHACLSDIGGR
jgi:UDP-glucose 4-epimerase